MNTPMFLSVILFAIVCLTSGQEVEVRRLPYANWFVENLFSLYTSNGDSLSIKTADLEHMMVDMGITYHERKLSKAEEKCYTAQGLGNVFSVDGDKISQSDYKDMCASLVLIGTTEDCTEEHNHDRHIVSPHWFIDTLFEKFSTSENNNTLKFEDLHEIYHELGITYHERKLKHSQNKRINAKAEAFSECYTENNLKDIFSLDPLITKAEFKEMCASLVSMRTKIACTFEHDHSDHDHESCITSSEKYIYGTISIITISAVSLISVAVVGKFQNTKQVLINILSGLALGTLLSDALLHLLPQALGLHDHGEENGHDHEHEHGDEEEHDLTYVWIMSVTMATIFVLWALETILHKHDHANHHNHNHGHSHKHNDIELEETKVTVINGDLTEKGSLSNNVTVKTSSIQRLFGNFKHKAWPMIIGDLLHNLADGLVLGAAFSDSLSLGISTALAILFHEIPHEIGDFSLMRKFGFTYLGAIIINIISGLSALLSFYIVASIKTTGIQQQWIFGITAGIFLYIALVDVLPEIKEIFEERFNGVRNWNAILLISFFMILGWVFMLLLALYEEQIAIDLGSSC